MERKRVRDVASIYRGVSYKKAQSSKTRLDNYIAVLRANNISKGVFINDDLVFVPQDLVSDNQLVFKDDIVITMSSGSKSHVGKVAIAKETANYAFGAFCAKISPYGVDPYYLYYILLSDDFRKHIEAHCKGTNINNIKQSYILDYEIPIPSITKQKLIVKEIEESLSQLDSAVATLNKTKQQLEIYRQAVLREVFTKCDQSVEIKTVCKHVTDGDHMPPPKAKTGIPFIMISNIDGNTIDWSDTAFVGKEYYNNIGDKRTPQKGDVLYTVTGSFGIPVLIDFEKAFCFQRHIALLRPNDKIEQEFLYYALQDSTVYAQASKRATGTAQKTVGLTVLRTIKIPFTESKEKQTKMVSIIKNRLSQCDIVEKTVNQSLQQAEALRQSILKQAFEG